VPHFSPLLREVGISAAAATTTPQPSTLTHLHFAV
jgi:hypothetical protein